MTNLIQDFKIQCKANKEKFHGVKNGNFISSKLVSKFILVNCGKGLKKELVRKERVFYIFNNTSGGKFDFSQIFTYKEMPFNL